MKVLNGRIWTYEEISEIPEHSIILNGKEVEIMASSDIHAVWLGQIYLKLYKLYKDSYWILIGEIGILISKEPLIILASDIAIISKSKMPKLKERILEIPPDLVIEIEKEKEEVDIEEKINYYSSIGVKRQIWVLLSRREILVIEDNKRVIYSFDDEVELLEGKKMKFSDVEKEVTL
ncbi:MAG: Uma2 family endonuclease [candidate division WOR-3 bacterium]